MTWTEDKENYLVKIHKNKSNKEIASLFNKKFNINISEAAISSRKKRLNLISSYKYAPVYSKEIITYIKNNHKGKSLIELSQEINKKFNIKSTPDSLNNLKTRIKKKEGFIFEPARNDGCIKKGNIPKNKGKRWNDYLPLETQERCRKTTFKKGNVPVNSVPVGTIKLKKYSGTKDSKYWFIKYQDGKGDKNWKALHVYLYEQVYGKVPKGHKVLFADGNRENFDLDNLILVTNSQQLLMNRNKLLFDNAELTKTGVNIAKIMDKVYKLRKNEK